MPIFPPARRNVNGLRAVTLARVHVGLELTMVLLELCHVELFELRLGVEAIDVAQAALHEEEDRNQAVLPERNAELGMSGDLKDEPPVPPFLKKLFRW
jgi:hypothetical protein